MIVTLAGGVGGARFAQGLVQIVGSGLAVVVNTGDDFEHLGLPISPDLDTVVYTLAGIEHPEQGWGLARESWSFLEQLGRLGGPVWFRLGDTDLALHALRRQALEEGQRLTTFTAGIARRMEIAAAVLPMSDDPVRTVVRTPGGDLGFQDYFVRLRCEVPVIGFAFAGAEVASPTPEIIGCLTRDDLRAIFIAPSNPFVSIDPILSIPGLRDMIQHADVPIVAISPIVGGAALKGPAAKMMLELGFEVSALTIAQLYSGLASGIVIDERDAALAPAIRERGLRVLVTDTIMAGRQERRKLAAESLAFAERLSREGGK